jgi:polyisoprenoid-binding protein YceI
MTSQSAIEVLAIPDAAIYRIDSELSSVTYASRHMFGLGKVHANFRLVSGLLEVGLSLLESTASATIDAASFSSDSARRDADVKSSGLLDVAHYPRIEFTSTDLRAGGRGIVMAGIVAMHGVETAVEVAVVSWEAPTSDKLRVLARATHLDRYAFGITGSKGLVGRYFDLELDVVAVAVTH